MASLSGSSPACLSVRPLVVWALTDDLTGEERRLVDEHVGRCDSCTDLLRFAAQVKEQVAELSPHPEAEDLVLFFESPSALDPHGIAGLEEHLALCNECAEELRVLKNVKAEEDAEELVAHDVPPDPSWVTPRRSRPRTFWRTLVGAVFHPIPAACYLTAALILAGILARGPAPKPEPSLRSSSPAAPAPLPSVLGGVVRLVDDRYEVRDGTGQPKLVQIIEGNVPHFLLLEFADLEHPPEPDAMYKVRITAHGSAKPSWAAGVKGADFLDNYTLCLFLQAGTLTPAEYALVVLGPTGAVILQDSLTVR